MIKATVICDASYWNGSKRNPSKLGYGGWAAWCRIDTAQNAVKGWGAFRGNPASSTEAEVMAALNGIAMMVSMGADEILVRSDCMAVEHLIHGKTQNQSLIKLWTGTLASVSAGKAFRLRSNWIKGHRLDGSAAAWVNNWCDVHAKKGQVAHRRGHEVREFA